MLPANKFAAPRRFTCLAVSRTHSCLSTTSVRRGQQVELTVAVRHELLHVRALQASARRITRSVDSCDRKSDALVPEWREATKAGPTLYEREAVIVEEAEAAVKSHPVGAGLARRVAPRPQNGAARAVLAPEHDIAVFIRRIGVYQRPPS